jgi:hypothetical protein
MDANVQVAFPVGAVVASIRRLEMRRIVSALGAVLLMAAFTGSAASAGISSTWHRNNNDNGHERLICSATSGVWTCRYDSMPTFGSKSNDIGEFRGSAEAGWCPEWAADVCNHSTSIVVGETVYSRQAPFTLWQELIFTDGGDGLAPMYEYLVGPAGSPFPLVCPWYPTWDEALDHDYWCYGPA